MIPDPRCGRTALVLAPFLVGGCALLAACASTPTRFFTLDPVAPVQPVASGYGGPALKVLAVHIPPELDRAELVEENPIGEIKVHDFEHWSAPLGLTARQVLIQDLAGRLPAGMVLGPDAPAGANVTTVSVDVVAFHAGPSGSTMQAGWNAALPTAGAGAPMLLRSPLQQLQGPVASGGGSGTAEAFSALLGQLSDQIAATLPARVEQAMARQAEQAAEARAQTEAAAVRNTTQTRTTTTQKVSRGPS